MENLMESVEPFLSMLPDHIPPKESDFGAKSTLLPDTTPLSPNRFISLAGCARCIFTHILDVVVDAPQVTRLTQPPFSSNESIEVNYRGFASSAACVYRETQAS